MSNIFGSAFQYRAQFSSVHAGVDIVTIKVTDAFLQRYAHPIPPGCGVDCLLAIPTEHWLEAYHDGYAPKLVPHATSRSLTASVPINILSRYYL